MECTGTVTRSACCCNNTVFVWCRKPQWSGPVVFPVSSDLHKYSFMSGLSRAAFEIWLLFHWQEEKVRAQTDMGYV